MKTIRTRIEASVLDRLDRLVDETGGDREILVRQAITDKLEELEDIVVVQSRTAEPFVAISNEEVWRRLELKR